MAVRPVLVLLACLLFVPQGALADSLRVLVLTGDDTPDEQNTFNFQISVRPGLYGEHVIFASPYTGIANDSGIFRGNPAGQRFTVAQTGDTAPSGKSIIDLDTLGLLPSVNSLGQLAYPAILVSGPSFPNGLFRGNESERTKVFEDGDAAPGNGDLSLRSNNELAAVINDAGDVAFSASLLNTTGGSDDDEAIYYWDGTPDTFTQIARKGNAAPDGDGTLSGTRTSGVFAQPVLNEAGEVGFHALIEDSSNSSSFTDAGIFRSDGSLPIRIARVSEPAPGGGVFYGFSGLSMNEAGSVAFGGNLGFGSIQGIYRGNGTTLTKIAKSGESIPGGGETYSFFAGSVDLNDTGAVAFATSFDIFQGTEGLVVSDGTNSFLTARFGTSATPGDGIFKGPGRFALNNASQLAFTTALEVGGNAEEGLFLFDPANGLARIARTGDALKGSTITDLDFNGISGQIEGDILSLPDQADGLNDAGQVVFAFELADDRRGIAIWDSTSTAFATESRLRLAVSSPCKTGAPSSTCRCRSTCSRKATSTRTPCPRCRRPKT